MSLRSLDDNLSINNNKQIILWIQSLLININALEKLGIKNKKE